MLSTINKKNFINRTFFYCTTFLHRLNVTRGIFFGAFIYHSRAHFIFVHCCVYFYSCTNVDENFKEHKIISELVKMRYKLRSALTRVTEPLEYAPSSPESYLTPLQPVPSTSQILSPPKSSKLAEESAKQKIGSNR